MLNWYFLSLASLLLIGAQRFMYKVAASRDLNPSLTTLYFMLVVALLSSFSYVFGLTSHTESSWKHLILLAGANSFSFTAATVCNIYALRKVSSSIAYPLIRFNILLVVLFSVVFLKESLSWIQVLGIAFSLGSVLVLSREFSRQEEEKKSAFFGALFILLAMFFGAAASISCKLAAEHTDKMGFIAVSYWFSVLFSLVFYAGSLRRNKFKDKGWQAAGIGVLMGGLNLLGFYFYLAALELGPLSIVASINGMHFLVAVLLSVIIYRERFNQARAGAILLAVVALILLR